MKSTIQYLFLFVVTIPLLYSCNETKADPVAVNKEISVDSLIIQFPDSIPLLINRGETYLADLKLELALADGAKAFRLDTNNLEARLLYADVINNRPQRTVNDVLQAQNHFKYIVNKAPKNTRAIVGLASTYLYQQDFDRIFQYANEALRVDPKLRDAYVLKGTAYMILNNLELAKSSYETAVQQDPNFYVAYFRLGQIYQAENNPRCVEYFVTAQKLNPDDLEFKYQVAFSKESHGQLEGAKEMYREMAADTVDVYVSRGLFHQGYIKQFTEKDLDSALYFYKSALETEPRYIEAWFNLGIAHEEKGNKSQALSAYANCLKYNPEFQEARIRANKLR
tara:strand:- start:4829 stop:5842 length:1014 start_codon:yes stop_codon:yes gene_type:complete